MIHKLITPKSREVTLSFIVPEDYVGEEMEVVAFIKKKANMLLNNFDFFLQPCQEVL